MFASSLRVLVVEDEPLYAEQLEMTLARLCYQVVGPVADAKAALALLAGADAPDLALLDIHLDGDGPDGVELGRRLADEYALPLIFLTSQPDQATFARARTVRPAAYLVKPVDPDALQRAIELAVLNAVPPARPADPADEQPATTALAPVPSPFMAPDSGVLLPQALFLKENGLLVKVMLPDVQWVEASDGGCRLVLAQGRTVAVRQLLRELAPQLPAETFIQIHRSYVVNVRCIESIDPVRGLVQIGSQLLPLSRRFRDVLLSRLRQL